ncbi:MAG: hypothetical protein NUV94_03350 [Candidatus Acetothermia bacterium]|nr:hypothetical protein [Candidatus Acetothermia bacterium]
MQLERNGHEITLSIDVPKEAVQTKEQELLRALAREVKVPGFRPGKAPTDLLLRHYGEDTFRAELKEALIREWLARTLEAMALHPVTTPRVETVAFTRGGHLAFRAKFEVLPEVVVPDELPIEVAEPPPAEVNEEELAAVLADLRREAAVLEPKTGPAEEGDVVHIRRGDRVWEGEASAARPIGKQLLGATPGARVILTDEGGQSEEFEVTAVYRVLLPSPEEAASHYGFASWDAFREEVRAELLRQAEARRRHEQRVNALDALADAVNVDVPPGLLQEVLAEEIGRLRGNAALRPEVEAAVRRRLRREILARRLAEQKGLLPSEEEVKTRAREGGEEEAAVRGRLLFERAADWIIERARRSR